jgi:hypothetical protein
MNHGVILRPAFVLDIEWILLRQVLKDMKHKGKATKGWRDGSTLHVTYEDSLTKSTRHCVKEGGGE